MHMLGTPATMQDDPRYHDVVGEVVGYLTQRRDALEAAGIARDKIALDPGIGFGKTHQHNITLAAHCDRLHALGQPILVGHSRKGFIGKVLGDKEADRLAGTIGVALALARQGVQIIRVHDVAPVRQALLLFEAVGGIDGQPIELSNAVRCKTEPKRFLEPFKKVPGTVFVVSLGFWAALRAKSRF